MSWRELLAEAAEAKVLPWLGGPRLVDGERAWRVHGELPPEVGWHRFELAGRRATWRGEAEADWAYDEGRRVLRGVVVGDRLVPDGAAVHPDPTRLVEQTFRVWLVEPGLERFARALVADRGDGRWVYVRQELPLGPEPAVVEAFEDRRPDLAHVPEVPPALDLAFRWVNRVRERAEAAERRAAAEAARLAEQAARDQARAERDARRRERRATLPAALADALSLSGAELLDFRTGRVPHEVIVQFRFQRRRYECVVRADTLGIVDAGICLTDEDTGERGDSRLTLESLPPVIAAARREGVLVVYRHL